LAAVQPAAQYEMPFQQCAGFSKYLQNLLFGHAASNVNGRPPADQDRAIQSPILDHQARSQEAEFEGRGFKSENRTLETRRNGEKRKPEMQHRTLNIQLRKFEPTTDQVHVSRFTFHVSPPARRQRSVPTPKVRTDYRSSSRFTHPASRFPTEHQSPATHHLDSSSVCKVAARSFSARTQSSRVKGWSGKRSRNIW